MNTRMHVLTNTYMNERNIEMLGAHVVGIVLFATLLASATDPTLYDNRMWARVNQNINNE